ncbi:ras-related and estrogen-regulated growth inhibitor-like protein [Amia ocellicauda]|uniref:ras-related and estrogen-regulated growth inhibitor-like protein n=1 Tax=Amia ocellicauda TaxID=2972642 RepID=UPI0034641679
MVVQVKPGVHPSTKTMEGNQHKVEANILLLGAENVGKSALTVRFMTRRFIGEYGDIESIYSHSDKIDGKDICFNIWDSLYQENCADAGIISQEQLRWADGFILVYSICDRQSFQVVRQQVQRIRQAGSRRCRGGAGGGPVAMPPIVIVGNKRDLQHRREVSAEEGRLLALAAGPDCGFFEVSAAEAHHGALLVFHGLLERIREARGARKGSGAGSGTGLRGIVRSVSAVFGRRRTE